MISIQFSNEVGDRYEAIRSGELEGLINKETMGTHTEQVLKLIAEYEASRVLLSEQEYELQKLEINYDCNYAVTKEKFMDNGYKSTEAREQTKHALSGDREKIICVEKDIALLKANIHSVEYQLRLKFLQLKEDEFQPSIQDILEAR